MGFSELSYHIFKDLEIPFDEKGATCGTVRLVQWVKEGENPNIDKAKLEIRKVYTSGAEEKLGKGYTFSTPEGPSELVEGLIDAGDGDTKNVLRKLRDREDILDNMGSDELSANLFRISQTEQKLKKDNIQTEKEANKTHYNIGKNIREVIAKNGGTMPEELPTPKKSLKQLEKENKKTLKRK